MSGDEVEEKHGGDADEATVEELRTIGFRLREIQRLLGMRVVQENKRLENEGLDPVEESKFFKGRHRSEDEHRE